MRWQDHIDSLLLSPTQRDIMQILCTAAPGLLSCRDLARRLYGAHYPIEHPEVSVRSHICYLRKRLALTQTPLVIESRLGPRGGYKLTNGKA